ncbi:MAG: molybdopterin oxidoreductase [Chloroflexi bacterium]|nr:MAG: molybdopterin oxidoreductase [Chloroflexota bacterium]
MTLKRILVILVWIAILAITLVGLGAVVIRAINGLGVTNLNYIVPWGLWVAFYIYFIGLSAGSFLLSTMVYVFGVKRFEPVGRIALFSALMALIAGLLFVLLDLGHMERFWTVFARRNLLSVLSIEIHFYILYIIILCLELWLLMRRDLIRCGQGEGWQATFCRILALGSKDLSEASARRDMRWVKVLGIIGLPTAIGVHGGTGALFAVVKARPMWYGPLFPIIFIVSALASGAALLTFVVAFFSRFPAPQRKELTLMLGKLAAGILAFDLLLMWSEFSVGFYGNIPEDVEVLKMMMFGPFWWVFWLQQILFGALVPIVLILWPRTGRNPFWVGLAGLMIVVGIVGVRLNIVIPALSLPVLPGLVEAYSVLPAPTVATPAISHGVIIWLQRGAILLALATVIFFGVVALYRSRRDPAAALTPAQRALDWAISGVAALAIAFLVVSWLGGGAVSLSVSSANFLGNAFGGIANILQPGELKSLYFPSPNEWLSSFGLIGFTIVLAAIGWQVLPLESEEGH